MLEGTLDSFTLPDVFQLLSLTKKSGCLRLHRDEERGRVYFRDGQVYYALSSSGRLALGRRLAGAGLVTTPQLQAALESQERVREHGEGLRLGRILVQEGVIDEDTLETFVREQIQDAVFDLMRWTSGAFSFDAASENAQIDEPVQLTASVENLIMEGSRRIEEWAQIRRKIPSLESVVDMAPTPGDKGVEVNLKPEEWRLLTVVDGRRTVQDLVELFGQGEFHTCRVLYGLEGAGLLEIRDPAVQGPSSIAELLAQQDLLRALEADLDVMADELVGDAAPVADVAAETPVQETEPEAEAASEADASDLAEEPAVTDDAGPAEQAAEEAAEEAAPEGEPELAGATAGKQLTTDPSIDADLVRRLIDGVKGL